MVSVITPLSGCGAHIPSRYSSQLEVDDARGTKSNPRGMESSQEAGLARGEQISLCASHCSCRFSQMRERYSDWAFPVPQLIAAAEASDDQLFVWPVFGVGKLEHWHGGRTVLIGDAAHGALDHLCHKSWLQFSLVL